MASMQWAKFIGLHRHYYLTRWALLGKRHNPFEEYQRDQDRLFIHIPKAAGMSVRKSLELTHDPLGHPPAIAFRAGDQSEFDRRLKFAVTRDPVERFVSAFYFLKGGGMNERDQAWSEDVLSGIDDVNELISRMSNRRFASRVLTGIHFNPQHFFVTGYSGRLIVDKLIPLEQLDAQLPFLLGEQGTLRKLNKSRRQENSSVSHAGRDYLCRIYRKDIELHQSALNGTKFIV